MIPLPRNLKKLWIQQTKGILPGDCGANRAVKLGAPDLSDFRPECRGCLALKITPIRRPLGLQSALQFNPAHRRGVGGCARRDHLAGERIGAGRRRVGRRAFLRLRRQLQRRAGLQWSCRGRRIRLSETNLAGHSHSQGGQENLFHKPPPVSRVMSQRSLIILKLSPRHPLSTPTAGARCPNPNPNPNPNLNPNHNLNLFRSSLSAGARMSRLLTARPCPPQTPRDL